MSKTIPEMTRAEFHDWAERWERDIFRLAARRGHHHGVIRTDAELAARALTRRLQRSKP